MKLKTILISAGASVICAALPCYVAITGLAASPTEAVIPTGSIIYDVNGEEYGSLSRFDTSADGRAAKYIAEEKSSYLTWFYCVFGNGRSASERLAYILKPEGSPSERISVAKYLEQNYSAEQLSSMLCSAVEFHDGIYGFDNAAASSFPLSVTSSWVSQMTAAWYIHPYSGSLQVLFVQLYQRIHKTRI